MVQAASGNLTWDFLTRQMATLFLSPCLKIGRYHERLLRECCMTALRCIEQRNILLSGSS